MVYSIRNFTLQGVVFALIGLSASGAQTIFTDPANLRGERVKPHDGRELPIDQGARGLEQMLRKLNTRASLMFIVAHPDDEDGGMLTYCSRGLGARVAMLTLTRGEGGQNAMTGDFEDALGLLRTQELLAADRYFGVDQMFGTEVDFGFSKTKEEAFRKWTHERVLYDAVRAVRLYRPMVIAATFIGGVTDGHGQHQVSGEIAQEVFKAAGDPKVFPELAKEGILPWQPLKVYARVPRGAITSQGLFDYATNQYAPAKFVNYVTGEVTTTAPTADVIVHEGKTDPLLSTPGEPATSYVQFARVGLGQQKSQIGANERVPPAGIFDVGYHRYGSRVQGQKQIPEESFFDGLDTSVAGIQTLLPRMSPALGKDFERLSLSLEHLAQARSGATSNQVATELAGALTLTNQLIASLENGYSEGDRANAIHELRVKRVQLNDALALALGTQVDATTEQADVVQGGTAKVRLHVTDLPDVHPSSPITVHGCGGGSVGYVVQLNSGYDQHNPPPIEGAIQTQAPMLNTVTQPYFYRDSIEEPVYKLRDPALRNAPATPPVLAAWSNYSYGGATFEVGRVVHAAAQPVRVVPEASLRLSTHAQIFPSAETSVAFSAFVAPVPAAGFQRTLTIGDGWQTGLAMGDFTAPGETTLQIKRVSASAAPTTLKAAVKLSDGTTITQGFLAIGYGNLPRTNYYTPATMRVVPAALKLPVHHRIGYVPGTGDGVADALSSIGLKPTMLSIAELTPQKLSQLDTVILGVRTYAAHPELHGVPTQALLEFARSGGNVVLQYQTSEFTAEDAPYSLTLGNAEKVVDETDPVKLLDVSSPSSASPNKLSSADFNGWVEERGHGFLGTWDAQYTALTETADPGQAPQRGGWITARVGRGNWTYCAFALYRQLPEAVPGAYRILMNQLALADQQ